MSADPGMDGTTHESAARSLGAFLRRMRDQAEPRRSRASRRRAIGLRREEVALDAGISATWYTWLEQGRPVRVSRRTLLGIARALRLNPTERAHLLRLADAASAPRTATHVSTEVTESLRVLADGLEPHAVYVVNGLWDVLYANATGRAVFGDFDARSPETGNVLRRLFLDEEWRHCFADRDSVVTSAVAQFRAATAHMVGDARWKDFVTRLAAESRDFADRWHQHELATASSREKVVVHPSAGRLSFLYASVAPDAEPADVRLIVYTPADEATSAALARLRETRRGGEHGPLRTTSGARSKPRAARSAAR